MEWYTGTAGTGIKTHWVQLELGMVLDPILFTIYVNLLLNLEIDGNILAYVKDTILFFEDDNWIEVENKANLGLSVVNK